MKIKISGILFFLILVLFSSKPQFGYSQPLKGRFLLGSGVTLNLGSTRLGDTLGGSTNSSYRIGLSPELSYLITNRFSIGLTAMFAYGSSKLIGQNTSKGSGITILGHDYTYGVGLLIKYYFPVFSEKFGINLQGMISYQNQYSEGDGGTGSWSIYNKSDNFYFVLTPVIYYFPHPRLEFNLSSLALQAYFESKYNPSLTNGNYNQRYGLTLQYPTGISFAILFHIGK
ncbi:MAG: outer membrane protein transport protein [Cytophagales bacterium]|nr:outer membrane protein transport protein [Cytophagales bacterium]